MWSGTWRVAPLFLLVVALTFVSGAAAQYTPEPNLRLEAHPEEVPLVPGAPAVAVPVEVILECVPPDAAPAAGTMDVLLSAAAEEPWVNLTLEPANVSFDVAECAGDGPVTRTVQVGVAVARDAPAGQGFPLLLRAKMSSGDEAQEEWRQRVGIVMEADAWLGEVAYKAGPNSRIQIPVHIENNGNGPVAATFRLIDNTSDALNIALPGQQIIDAQTRHVVPIDLQTPFENGYIDQEDMVHVKVVLRSALDVDLTQEKALSASVHTVGSYVPGPGPLLLVALVGLAWLVRRGTDPKY